MKLSFEHFSMRNMKFRKKMLIIYLICIIIPIIFISTLYCFSTVNRMKNNNLRELEYNTVAVRDSIEDLIDRTRMISDIIYYDKSVNESLTMSRGSIQEFINNAKRIDSVNVYLRIYAYIESIEIYSSNEKLYNSSVLRQISYINDKDSWYNEFVENGENFSIISHFSEEKKRPVVSVVRKLDNYGYNSGILKLDISYQSIVKELIYNTNKGNVYFLDESDRVIATTSENIVSLFSKLCKNDAGIEKELKFPAGYKIYCEYKDNHSSEIIFELIRFFVLLLIVIIVSIVMGYFATLSMAEKLKELTAATVKMQNGRFEKISEDNTGTDEIGLLTNGFNLAVERIDTLIKEVYNEKIKSIEREKEKKQAEYIALQSQINPHFIFNILEILRMKCVKNGDLETATTVKSLSVMIRNLIKWKKDIITVENEMDFVNAFISLSCFSFENEVLCEIFIDENAKKCMIPKMTVQVFVENAFRHGFESILKNYVFKLNISMENNRLIIRVQDNGCGIDKELVDAINSGDVNYIKSRGVGIANVFARGRLYFGEDLNIRVTSIPFEKTEITLSLPVQTEEA